MVSQSEFQDLKIMVDKIREDLDKLTSTLNTDKEQFKDVMERIHVGAAVKMDEIVNDATAEFNRIRAAGDALHDKTAMSVADIHEKLAEMRKEQGTGNRKDPGYLPQNNMVPKAFSDKTEEWRIWQEEIEDYMDSVNPGMKALLSEINKEKELVDITWRSRRTHI